MASKFQIVRERKGDWDVFTISGAMTEEAGVKLLSLYSDSGIKCRFVLRDVEMINSYGTRAWMLFLRDFQNDRQLELVEVSPVMLAQINMLPSFAQKAKVMSVYVPLFCEACKTHVNVLVDHKDYPEDNDGLKPGRCKHCGGPTTLASDENFFDFANR